MAFTGVGCYGLVPMLMPDRKTEWAAQMGAEGTLWVGLQSFVDVPHAFQNLGEWTNDDDLQLALISLPHKTDAIVFNKYLTENQRLTK